MVGGGGEGKKQLFSHCALKAKIEKKKMKNRGVAKLLV